MKKISSVKIGETVRLVEMNGCMAHRRENIRTGIVTAFLRKQIYGSVGDQYLVRIRLEDNNDIERIAEDRLWTEFEGVLEYRG